LLFLEVQGFGHALMITLFILSRFLHSAKTHYCPMIFYVSRIPQVAVGFVECCGLCRVIGVIPVQNMAKCLSGLTQVKLLTILFTFSATLVALCAGTYSALNTCHCTFKNRIQ